jgi:hypothetical protein
MVRSLMALVLRRVLAWHAERATRRAIQVLERQGYRVRLEPAA